MHGAQTWRDQRERRFHPSRDDARRVLAALRQRLPIVRYHDGDTSLVVTTYLDTRGGHYYQLAERSDGRHSLKMRIREYLWTDGASGRYHYADTCFLERKQRDGEVRLKQRVRVAKSEVTKIVLGDVPLRERGPEADAIRAELESLRLRPVMVTAYERLVFGDDAALRITYDERIAFHPPPRGLYNMAPALTPEVLGAPLASGPSRVLEIKQPSAATMPAWLAELVAALPADPGYSKFRDGMRALRESDGAPVELTRRLTPL
ncbi:MAG: VTC domain-containing protein [Deltaproteobacteria bacterium]|nr:MAG: VTC domain-containing protein [Deltaproteobacteria bacterium]